MNRESHYDELIDSLKSTVLARIDITRDVNDDEVKYIISDTIAAYSHTAYIPVADRTYICQCIFNSIRGLDILEELFCDDSITEIMINGYENIYIEKNGRLLPYGNTFSSKDKLYDVIQSIVSYANRRVNESSPIVDTRLPDGSRVNIVLNPISLDGHCVTIRRFPKHALTMDDLIASGSISPEAASFLHKLVISKYNMFICGGTGCGKTTFLNILSNYIPSDERIITIEDSAELRLCGIDNLVRLEARPANTEGENEVTLRQLIRTALRMRPDRIIVGEVRGKEALDMLQAMNTGHDGSLSTGHGNNPSDMLKRLETMVMMGINLPLDAIRGIISSGIDIMIHLGRLRDGRRCVLDISELLSGGAGNITLNPIYRFDSRMRLVPTGNQLSDTEKFKMTQDILP